MENGKRKKNSPGKTNLREKDILNVRNVVEKKIMNTMLKIVKEELKFEIDLNDAAKL